MPLSNRLTTGILIIRKNCYIFYSYPRIPSGRQKLIFHEYRGIFSRSSVNRRNRNATQPLGCHFAPVVIAGWTRNPPQRYTF